MRGKIVDDGIYGDWLYDWSKIYQSLIGYDVILLSKIYQNHTKSMIFFSKSILLNIFC